MAESIPRVTVPAGVKVAAVVPFIQPSSYTRNTASAYQAPAGTSRKGVAEKALQALEMSSASASWESSQKPMPPSSRSAASPAFAAMEVTSS